VQLWSQDRLLFDLSNTSNVTIDRRRDGISAAPFYNADGWRDVMKPVIVLFGSTVKHGIFEPPTVIQILHCQRRDLPAAGRAPRQAQLSNWIKRERRSDAWMKLNERFSTTLVHAISRHPPEAPICVSTPVIE
jgi:hypothetical protein